MPHHRLPLDLGDRIHADVEALGQRDAMKGKVFNVVSSIHPSTLTDNWLAAHQKCTGGNPGEAHGDIDSLGAEPEEANGLRSPDVERDQLCVRFTSVTWNSAVIGETGRL
jgi:hypothetical protein